MGHIAQAAGVLLAGNVSLSKLPNLFDSGTKVKVVTYFDIFLPYSSLKILKDALTQVGAIGDDIDNVWHHNRSFGFGFSRRLPETTYFAPNRHISVSLPPTLNDTTTGADHDHDHPCAGHVDDQPAQAG